MRGVPRWLAVLAVVAIVTLVCAFSLHEALTPASMLVRGFEATLPADGFASANSRSIRRTGRDLRGLRVEIDNPTAPPWTQSPLRETPPSYQCAQAYFPATPRSNSSHRDSRHTR